MIPATVTHHNFSSPYYDMSTGLSFISIDKNQFVGMYDFLPLSTFQSRGENI